MRRFSLNQTTMTGERTVSETAKDRARHAWIDVAKGYAIILVVYGHTVRGLVNGGVLERSSVLSFIDGWIYTFHMPVFFFVSGLFVLRTSEEEPHQFFVRRLRTIAYPYFVWSVITLLAKSTPIPTNHAFHLTDFWLIFYAPIDQFWFLYVLFFLLVSSYALLNLGLPPWVFPVLAVVIYPGVLPVTKYGWTTLLEFRSMAIYFGLGIAIGSYVDLRRIATAPPFVLVPIFVFGALISVFGGFEMRNWGDVFKPILGAGGVAAVISLALLTRTQRLSGTIELLGRHSLEIYLVHTFASAGVRIVLIGACGVSAPFPHIALGILAGLVAPLIVKSAFEAIGFRSGFVLADVRSGVANHHVPPKTD